MIFIKKWLPKIRIFFVIGMPIIIVFVGLKAFSILSHKEQEVSAVTSDKEIWEVDVVKLTPREVTINVEGYGTVRSQREALLTSKVSGRIFYIAKNFQVGSFVKQDDVLLKLEQTEYQITYDSAKADLEQSQSERDQLFKNEEYLKQKVGLLKERVELAKSEWTRNKSLEFSNRVSQTDLEKTRSNYLQIQQTLTDMEESFAILPYQIAKAKAIVSRNEANLKRAKYDLENTVIKAPFSAQVIARDVEIGQYINSGSGLGTLAYDKVYEISVAISPEKLKNIPYLPVENLPDGLKHLEKAIGTPKAKVYWSAFGSTFSWDGEVSRMKPVDPITRTVSLVVQVRDPWSSLKEGNSPLFTGIYCRVVIEGRKRENVMLIPEEALREDDSIYLLRNGVLAMEKVAIVDFLRNYVAIAPLEKDSIAFDELVIISPVTYPVPGMSLLTREQSTKGIK